MPNEDLPQSLLLRQIGAFLGRRSSLGILRAMGWFGLDFFLVISEASGTLLIMQGSFQNGSNTAPVLAPRIGSSLPSIIAFAVLLLCGAAATSRAVFYPVPRLVNKSVGLLDWDLWRGSGCVAWDPRLVFSCAHVLYENGWAQSNYTFYPGCHSGSFPSSGGFSMRGYRHFTDYASYAQAGEDETAEAYDLDFVILYNNSDVADSVGAWYDGGAQLRSRSWKMIAGYPETVDFTGDKGFYYQHSTDLFTKAAYRDYGSYHGFDGVSTGGGNSGGPVFVYDAQDKPVLAGILVSGSSDSAGVRALDDDTKKMAEAAVGNSSTSVTVWNRSPLSLPDGVTRWSTRSVEVAGLPSSLSSLEFSSSISTTYRGDLDVYLKSPRGRTRWITKRQGGGADNLVVKGANYTAAFPGNPNGKWTLYMRDAAKGDLARFRNFSLVVGAR